MIKLKKKGLFNLIKRTDPYHDVIECLVAALEARDVYTSGHSSRVSDMAYDLGKEMGITGAKLEELHIAAHLHDIGKLGIPDHILNKEGKLLPHEFDQIKQHPEIGSNIIKKSKSLEDIATIILYHHERWDGKGYPKGLKGTDIPLGARIIALCDSIDAMTSERPYRSALSWDECIREVLINKGVQFDPVVVDAVSKLWNEWRKPPLRAESGIKDSPAAS